MGTGTNLTTLVAWSGFGLALIFGAVASKTNFCTMGAVSDVVNMGNWGRMRMWLLAIAVAIIVLPQGVAFATLAGLPPQYGLYAAMVPAVIGALFGSSWHLVSGPTNAISLVVFATLSHLAEPGSAKYISLALSLTLMVGVPQLAMGLARLG